MPASSAAKSADRVARTLSGLVAHALRRAPRDMSLTAMMTLWTLERHGNLRNSQLAAAHRISAPSMTAIVDSLVREGLASRQPHPTDRRGTIVSITPAGLAFVKGRRSARQSVFKELIVGLKPDEREALLAALPALERLNQLADLTWPDPASSA